MKFNQWIGRRSQLGKELLEERIQNLTDQWWEAKQKGDDQLAEKLKHKLNTEYNTSVLDSKW
jgi:hypothetical protein